jgi:hypothetical protein
MATLCAGAQRDKTVQPEEKTKAGRASVETVQPYNNSDGSPE